VLSAVFAAGVLAGGTIAPGLRLADRKEASAERPAEVLAPAPLATPPLSSAGVYPAEVLRVLDGDTFEARVRTWPGIEITTRVRLRGIDAAEMKSRCPEERVKAQAARDGLAAMLAEGEVTVSRVGLDKYGGRVDADAATRRTVDVSRAMLARGLARPYGGGRRGSWCAPDAS
jgi:endonuclease YncB( thermonuclease family)